MLAGSALGTRLNRLYRENMPVDEILALLDDLFGRFVAERQSGEPFGDYLDRSLFEVAA
jgi:sulfite reductase (NADPH) hemoprotein beta-component